MKSLVLLGDPVSHSLSPRMQKAALKFTGLKWDYRAIATQPQQLMDALSRLRSKEWLGANVTIPLKQVVVPLLDELAETASEVSAVNTIVLQGDRLVGHNTDRSGFMHDLRRRCDVDRVRTAAILGAGGGAWSVAFGLAQQGIEIQIVARSLEAAETLSAAVREAHAVRASALPWVPRSFVELKAGLIVNATSVGMHPASDESAWPMNVEMPADAFVYDLVYSPTDTQILRQARLAGLRAASGIGMLVEQGALSFELWTGFKAPRSVMRDAVQVELETSFIEANSDA